jgi:cytochrome P450
MPLMGAKGNLIPFMRNPVGYMNDLYSNYGEVVSLARGTTKFVFVFGPEHNREVLSDTDLFYNLDASSSPVRIPENSSLSRLFAGLTRMNGPRHKQQRQIIAPSLRKKSVEAYYDDIVAATQEKLSGWQEGQQRDLFQEMRELTLTVAVKTLVGLDLDRGGRELCHLLDQWMNLVFSIFTLALPLNLPGLPYRRLLAVSEKLEKVIRDLIERKRKDNAAAKDVLSMLVRAHDEDDNRLSDDELVGQTNFLFMAGHATTASALTWALFLLAQHPKTMASALDECDEKLSGGSATVEQLDELSYLEAVAKETMRLLPPVLWWGRVSRAPFGLGGYEFPSGTMVIHSAYMTHHLASHYPQPKKFMPERWMTAHPGPYEYIPFSAGPRMCLGGTFAMFEIKLALAIILRRFRLSLPEKSRVDFSGLMLSAPKNGLRVKLNRQDRKITRSEINGTIRNIVDLN